MPSIMIMTIIKIMIMTTRMLTTRKLIRDDYLTLLILSKKHCERQDQKAGRN